eukprot:scaffold105895_cov36-Phaeocystis_antarctica.AAC.2
MLSLDALGADNPDRAIHREVVRNCERPAAAPEAFTSAAQCAPRHAPVPTARRTSFLPAARD